MGNSMWQSKCISFWQQVICCTGLSKAAHPTANGPCLAVISHLLLVHLDLLALYWILLVLMQFSCPSRLKSEIHYFIAFGLFSIRFCHLRARPLTIQGNRLFIIYLQILLSRYTRHSRSGYIRKRKEHTLSNTQETYKGFKTYYKIWLGSSFKNSSIGFSRKEPSRLFQISTIAGKKECLKQFTNGWKGTMLSGWDRRVARRAEWQKVIGASMQLRLCTILCSRVIRSSVRRNARGSNDNEHAWDEGEKLRSYRPKINRIAFFCMPSSIFMSSAV